MEGKPEDILKKQKDDHLNFKVLFETDNVRVGEDNIDSNLHKKIEERIKFSRNEHTESKDINEKLHFTKQDPDRIVRHQYEKNYRLNKELDPIESTIEAMEKDIESGNYILNDAEIQKVEMFLDNFSARKENLTKKMYALLVKKELTKEEEDFLYYLHEQMMGAQQAVKNLSKKYEYLTDPSIRVNDLKKKAEKLEEDIIKVMDLIKKRINAELN